MKYKALLTGNNKMVINEFFNNMDFSFECLSTSNRYDDILGHLKYLQPDVFVYCLLSERPEELKKFANTGHELTRRQVPIVIIGSSEECMEFAKIAPLMQTTVFQKPYSFQHIEESIVGMLDDRVKAKQRVEKKEKDVIASANDAVKSAEELIARLEAGGKLDDVKKHILVVDDDSSVLKLIKGYLSGRYEVATAKSGKVAMKFLETKSTDLVLLDYHMPEENGSEVLSKIRTNEKTRNLPVVFLTGVTDKDKIQEVLTMKPQGYLLKPIDMMKLTSTIKGIIGD